MSIAGSQQQTYLRLIRALRPHWRRDAALPARIQSLFSRHKEFGSRDRRLYRELLYTTLRYLPWVESLFDSDDNRAAKAVAWLAADTRDTRAYRAGVAGDWPLAHTLADRATFLGANTAALLPGWFREECPEVFESPELDVQLSRAPVWLRLQTADAAAVAAEFDTRQWAWRESDILPSAWKLLADADVTKSDAFAKGAFEVQDLGSQMLLEAAGVEPDERWLDACAGAGGKTLQLARNIGEKGSVDAFDVRRDALAELRGRAARAGLRNVRTVSMPSGAYDAVLVDAPCSGSGTWRRSPHLKWVTTPDVITERASLQASLLDRFAGHVRPGGRLIYATCSLARRENDAVVAAFLSNHPEFAPAPWVRTFGFEPKPGLTVLPARHDTDGFHVASLRRR